MSLRAFQEAKALEREAVCIMGSFAPNGSSAVSADSREGQGWSVARSDVGVFTITFNSDIKMPYFLGAVVGVQTNGAALTFANMGAYDASARTLIIRTFTEDTGTLAAADLTAHANTRINFVAWFRNSTVAPRRG